MITILLAEDHLIVRQGLRALLGSVPEYCLVGEAGDGPEALQKVEQHCPDVLVLDVMMPGLNGLEVARQTRQRSPRTQIVFLSMHANEAYVLEALRAGAAAYVLKQSSSDDLMKAINAVMNKWGACCRYACQATEHASTHACSAKIFSSANIRS